MECLSIAIDDTHVYCGGFTEGNLGETSVGSGNAFVLRVSKENGDLDWLKHFGESVLPGGAATDEYCAGIVVDNNHLYCASTTYTDFNGETNGGGFFGDGVVIKVKKDTGQIVWTKQLGSEFEAEFGAGLSDEHEEFLAIAQTETDIFCAGYTNGVIGENNSTTSSFGKNDVIVAKFSKADGSIFCLDKANRKRHS